MKKSKTPAEPATETGQSAQFAQFAIVDILTIQASPTNPRKTFPSESLASLAENIRRIDVLQPILIRPWPAHYEHPEPRPVYEIVAGERRWRASALADKTTIPATIRELTDTEVLEIQVIENLQREELHPLEEAEGYDLLMKSHGYTADTLAEKIGKSRAYIYARLKLCALAPEARKAFFAGDLTPSTALLIARIPLPELQQQAMTEIIHPQYKPEPLSARAAAEHIRDNYMLKLNGAPFYSPDYAPLIDAPNCRDCRERTGNQPEIYPDIDADVCTNPACFHAKKNAHKVHQAAETEARGLQVYTGEKAKTIAPFGIISAALEKGFYALDEPCYELPPVDGEYPTYREMLGTDFQAPALIENRSGNLVEIAQIADINAALKERGIEQVIKSTETSGRESEKEQARKAKAENLYRSALFDAIHQQLSRQAEKITLERNDNPAAPLFVGMNHDEHLLVVNSFFAALWYEYQKQLAKKWLPESKNKNHELIEEFRSLITTLRNEHLVSILIEMAIIGEISIQHFNADHQPRRMLATAKSYGINAAAIRKEVTKGAKTPAGKSTKARG